MVQIRECNTKLSSKLLQSVKVVYILAFTMPMLILAIAYAIFGIYPFGEKSVLVLDLAAQYSSYYERFRDVFYDGASPFISWSRNLTGEMMGLYAYYLASPFSVLFLIFPRSMQLETIFIMQLLKVGTASVVFCRYMRVSKNCTDSRCLIFSLLYSLMAYTVVQLMNPMWLDGLIYLPLICDGIEQLADKGKCVQFILSLALMFMAHFYIGWMLAIFSCLYFIVYYFCLTAIDNKRSINRFVISGFKFAVSGIIAAMCSAWLLIPLYYSLSLGKFTFTEPVYDIYTQFDFIDFFTNLLPNVYDTCRPEGAPLVYCGVLSIILVPLYYFNREIPLKRKVGYGLLSFVLIISMYVSNLDIVWHGMQIPNWMPFRYSFILSFLLLLMSYEALKYIKNISNTKLGVVLLAVCAYVFYIDKQDITVVYDTTVISKTHIVYTIWFTVILAVIYALGLYVYKKRIKYRKLLTALACILVSAELAVTCVYTFKAIDRDVLYTNYAWYDSQVALGRNTVDKIHAIDDSPVYRMEKNFNCTSNDPMAFGYYGITHSSSTLNTGVINFLYNMGFAYGMHYINYRGATYVTDALLGIKYVMETQYVEDMLQDTETEDSEQADQTAAVYTERTLDIFADYSAEYADIVADNIAVANGVSADMDGTAGNEIVSVHYNDNLVLTNESETQIIKVYENPNVLPIAFMSDKAITDLEFETWETPFENQNMLLSAMLSAETKEYFKSIKIDRTIPTNVKTLSNGISMKFERMPDVKEDCEFSVEYLFKVPTSDMVYMYFPAEYKCACSIYLNDEYLTDYYGYDTMTVLALGHFKSGETVSLKIVLDESEVYIKDTQIYYLDETMFENTVEMLKQQSMEITNFKEDHIKGTVTAETDGVLFTSITYEPGWTVYVDGVKTEYVKLADALIGVPIPVGEHSIEMRFFPKGLRIGICISVVGVLILFVIWLSERGKHTNIKGL